MNPDFLLAPSLVKANPKVNVSTNTVLLGFAVMGAAGALVWWQMKTKREAEAAVEAAEAELESLQSQHAWEQEEVARPGELGPQADKEAIAAINHWAAQWRWGKNGVEFVKGSWVWETRRLDTLEGGKVRVVKGKDRTFKVMPKQGGTPHRVLLKASGQIIELAL